VRDDKELIRRQMESTRHSLCEKIESLEQHVTETVSGAREAVVNTIDTVKGTVHDTVQTVREAFDIKKHVARHPYASMAAAAGVGFVLTRLLEGGRRRPRPVYRLPMESANGLTYAAAPRTPVDADVAGRAERLADVAAPAPQESRADWLADLAQQFEPELRQLKAMAIGTGIGILRDLLLPSVPEQYRSTLSDVANRVTEKVGGESYRVGTFNHLAETIGGRTERREPPGRAEPNGRPADAYACEGRSPL